MRKPLPPTISAFSQIAAGKASGSLGTAPASDGAVIGTAGNWLRYNSVDFGNGANALQMELAAIGKATGLKVELRVDKSSGTLIGSVRPATARQSKTTPIQITHVKPVHGVHDLYLVFVGQKGELSVDGFQFLTPPPKTPRSK